MKKIWNCYVVEMSLLMRNIIYWIMNLMGVGYMIFFMWSSRSYRNLRYLYEPCQILTSSACLTYTGMFGFMILGFYIVRREKANYCDEIIYSLPKGFSSKIISKILVLITSVTIFTLIITLEVYIFYMLRKVVPIIYWKSFLYVILYWIIPFIICGFIGMILALTVKSRVSYGFMIIIWILLTLLNELIFEIIMGIAKGRGIKLIEKMAFFFNIGQTDIHLKYQKVYGFPLELQRWYIKGFMLFLLMFIILFLVVKKNYNKTKRPLILMTVIFSIIIGINAYGFMIPTQVLKTNYVSGNPLADEKEFYMENRKPSFKNQDNFNVAAYDIKLSTIHQIKAETKINFVIKKPTDNLNFTLFHGLKVKEIKNKNNEKLSFQQKGDQFKVELNNTLKQGEKDYITVKYKGNSSAYYFANEQSVLLPANFPWIPIEGSYNAFTYSDDKFILTAPLNPTKEIQYKLQYKGPKKLCTNLEKTRENTWEGKVCNGITLVSGMMKEEKIGQDTIYYPISINNIHKALKEYIQEEEKIKKQIQKDLDLKIDNVDKHFFVNLPSKRISPYSYNFLKDHIILSNRKLDNYEDHIYKEDLPSEILNSELETRENYLKYSTYLLGYVYDYWYNIRFTKFKEENTSECNILENDISRFEESMEWYKHDLDKYNTMKKQVNERRVLKNYIDKNKDNEEIVNNFLKKWIKKIKSRSNFTVDNLLELLNKEESR